MSEGILPSPFPVRSSRMYVYATASELLHTRIPQQARIELWKQIPREQALSLIAQIITDIEINAAKDGSVRSDVDRRWVASVPDNNLRIRLEIASTLNVTIFTPQLLLLTAVEVLSYCPDGSLTGGLDSLAVLIQCMLGIGDETPSEEGPEMWGGLNVALASEIIANLHFNRTMWIAHQLAWIDRAWFQDWPKRTAETATVGGEPRDLFKEATGIDFADFAAVAFNVYVQAANSRVVRFPRSFFETLGLDSSAVEYFLKATSRSVPELQKEIRRSTRGVGSSHYGFDVFRRFPLVRLPSGELLVLSPNFVIQRALSEVSFWDVRNYLKSVSMERDEAFHQCTRTILENETGAALRRIFLKPRTKVFDEGQLQKKFASKKRIPKLCDYAVRSGNTWLLVEVTDSAMPRPVVLATANAATLDVELDKVLTVRKARQLASTIELLESERRDENPRPVTYIPLVLTGETAVPWNPAVHERTKERLAALDEFSEEFYSSVALITLKDLMILENAATLGYDILYLLKEWRQSDPGSPLDQYLHERGVPLSSPRWEKTRAINTVFKIVKRMSNVQTQ